MAEKNDNNNQFALLALVGIVAVVGIVMMATTGVGSGNKAIYEEAPVLVVDEEGNLVGNSASKPSRGAVLSDICINKCADGGYIGLSCYYSCMGV